MTHAFDTLRNGPQTGIDKSDLNFEERSALRRISVSSTRGNAPSNSVGKFTTVSYLDGDEREAAELFVTENRAQLEQIDFSKPNVVRSSVSREIYDWILHALGERRLEKLDEVVREDRRDEEVWIVARDKYEKFPSRRYAVGETGTVKLRETTPEAVYADLPRVTRLAGVGERDDVEGHTEWLFVYYDDHPHFDCSVEADADPIRLRKYVSGVT
jgi:hypothetical protein